MQNFLFNISTSQRALDQAWLKVKPRLAHSSDKDARKAESAFSQDVPRNIRALQKELRSSRFVFEPQRGVPKRNRAKAGGPTKAPRPLVVAPARSRIVQRAILDVCQSPDDKIRQRLGRIPDVVDTPTSVSGLSGRGVREAMALISDAIAEGATWFFRSDIKTFYQKIPKPRIEIFLRENISDGVFVDLL